MADLTWEGNSKAMFDKCIEGSPKPFRAMTEKRLLEGCEKRAGDSKKVTEDIVIETVKEITPKPFLPMALKSIEPLKSS